MSDATERLDAALKALDEALASRPHSNGYAFTAATQALCAYRDDLRRAVRVRPDAQELRRRLKSANLGITLLTSGHFPLGETPWAELEGLQGQLQALRTDEAA